MCEDYLEAVYVEGHERTTHLLNNFERNVLGAGHVQSQIFMYNLWLYATRSVD